MNRRDFLKGILTVPASGALLKVLGKEAEAEMGAKEPYVESIGATELFHAHAGIRWRPPEFEYPEDVTRFGDSARQYIDATPKGKRRL